MSAIRGMMVSGVILVSLVNEGNGRYFLVVRLVVGVVGVMCAWRWLRLSFVVSTVALDEAAHDGLYGFYLKVFK